MTHAHALAGSKRLQPRLLFLRHAAFSLAQVDNHVLAFVALDGGVDDLADAPNVLVVNRVALGLAHLLEDDLLGQLRRNATQNVSRLVGAQLAADFSRRIDALGVVQSDLRKRILHLFGALDDGRTA